MGYRKCLPSSTLTFFFLSATNKRYPYYFMTNQTIYSIWHGTMKEKKIPTTRLFRLVWFRVHLSPPPLASKRENGPGTQRVERWREREGEPFVVVSGDGRGKTQIRRQPKDSGPLPYCKFHLRHLVIFFCAQNETGGPDFFQKMPT